MSSGLPDTPLSEQFGFTADWREAQLTLAALTVTDSEAVAALQELLGQGQRVDSIVARFYAYLEAMPDTGRVLASFDSERLQAIQAGFLQSLGEAVGSAEYFEARIRMALVHLQLGIPQGVYTAAFVYQQGLLSDQIIQSARSKKLSRTLCELVSKLTALEILIAAEVYAAALPKAAAQLPRQNRPSYETYDNRLQRDALTGAAGRLTILKAIDSALESARRTGQPVSLILVELDPLELEADRQSSALVEQVLRELVVRLKASVREFDLIGRYGARSFLLLLENTSLHTCHQVANRVRRRVHETPVRSSQVDVPITVSQGLTDALSQDDQDSLLTRCNRALQQARSAGGDTVNEETGIAAGR